MKKSFKGELVGSSSIPYCEKASLTETSKVALVSIPDIDGGEGFLSLSPCPASSGIRRSGFGRKKISNR